MCGYYDIYKIVGDIFHLLRFLPHIIWIIPFAIRKYH